jgi:hypothetical protein
MFSWLKKRIRFQIKNLFFKPNYKTFGYEKWSPQVKIGIRQLWHYHEDNANNGKVLDLENAGFRVFSEGDEDGKLLALFAYAGIFNKTFVDIGGADGVNSNCANLAINLGWHGLFIDGSDENIRFGRKYYAQHPDTRVFPPKFCQAFVSRENINKILENQGMNGEVDLLSLDIDGNDYWIWYALEIVSPRVVIIETHIEFGYNNIVVPYDANFIPPGKHPDYHGASPVAMVDLAKKKGYRLVGSNLYGYNTIYLRNDLAVGLVPEISVEKVLSHPRNIERYKCFEPIKDWDYVKGEEYK